LAGLRLLQKQLWLWLLWWSGFSDGAEAVLENVWQNGFTCWIEVVKSPVCPFLFFPFFFIFPFPTSTSSPPARRPASTSCHAPPPPRVAPTFRRPCLGRRSRAFHSTSTRHGPPPSGLPLRLAVPQPAAVQLHLSLLLPTATAAGATRGHALEKGGGAGWSHENVAPPPLWKPRGAPLPAPHPEPVRFPPFGRAPGGAARGAAHGALSNRALIWHSR
jgi:hypothetical protein